ncbi:hypothetical protein BGY98DRAFT_939981 [Russula aff. rugulosa BPL654]|nr:hypothetical protein BGY98DRAFT_939981 [Russula aff. rugulosa BPL654]
MNSMERDTPHETFNGQFDALFGEGCRDSHGRLHYVHQGKLGMGLVVSYLSKLDWTSFPLDIVELKLQCLIAELQHLQRMDLKDTANTETPQLSFQRKAVQDFHSRQADENDPPLSSVGVGPNTPSSASTVPTCSITSVADSDGDDEDGIICQPTVLYAEGNIHDKGMVFPKLSIDLIDWFSDFNSGKIRKKSHTTLGNPQAVDADGLLIDVDVQPVTNNSSNSKELSTMQNMPYTDLES